VDCEVFSAERSKKLQVKGLVTIQHTTPEYVPTLTVQADEIYVVERKGPIKVGGNYMAGFQFVSTPFYFS